MRMKTAIAACLIAGLPWMALAQDWVRLDTDQIRETLITHDLIYENEAFQRFLESGRTLYRYGETSWGYWRAENDRYCSQWPPGQDWTCYDVEHDGGTGLRFIDDWGNTATGAFAE